MGESTQVHSVQENVKLSIFNTLYFIYDNEPTYVCKNKIKFSFSWNLNIESFY